jgi:hypothetical protein
MANKALAKRQKLVIRAKPPARVSKPRNPVALAAKQRAAGPHRKNASAKRQQEKRLLDSTLKHSPEEE